MESDERSIFEITVEGASGIIWSDWLDDITVTHNPETPASTVLRGPMDQSRLRGVLNRIWDLNLTLISVMRLEFTAVPAGGLADVDTTKAEAEQS